MKNWKIFDKRLVWSICLLALLWGSSLFMPPLEPPASAQGLNVVAWSGRMEAKQVKPGEKAKLLLTAKMEAGWHLYSLTQPPPPRATKIVLDESSDKAFTLDGAPQQPKPKVAFDPNFEMNTETFEGETTFTVPLKVAADASPGPHKIVVKVTFQACDDHQCLPPRPKLVEVEAVIAGASTKKDESKPSATGAAASANANQTPQVSPKVSPTATPTPEASPAPSATTGTVATSAGGSQGNPPALPSSNALLVTADTPAVKLKSSGLLSYIWLAMGFGFLALLTPCVFPMIPITVSFFTKREQRSHGAAIKQALVYCFGIIFTFTGLGLALTLIAGPAGIQRFATSPWMNLFLTALFVVFALNLFGMFEIRVPSSILSKLDSRAQSGTMAATLLMGLTFTLTSFTCTAAFVGTVLVAATRGEWLWATVGMLAFSTAFALPFFLLALFPQWLHALPKSGGWLNSVKVVMGFLELAAAFKFISNVDLVWQWQTISRHLVLAGWIALALVTAIYLLGKFQLTHDTPVERLGVMRMLMSTFFLGVAFYLLAGLFGAPLGELDAFLPPAQTPVATSSTPNKAQEQWLNSYDQAVQQARAANKPVFLNFTGVTCTNCRWMEKNMFPDPQVKKELGRFILAELYTDREDPEDRRNSELQEKQFGSIALPLYVVITPDGKELAQFGGLTRDKREFISFLQSGVSRFEQLAERR